MNQPIKLGFDAKRLFLNWEGLGTYARTLVKNLQQQFPNHEYHLFTTEINEELGAYFINHPNFKIHTAKGQKEIWRSKGVVKDLIREHIDLYFGLSNELPYGIDKTSIKTLVTIHDLLYLKFKSQFSWIDRLIYSRKFKYAINASNKIIATSQHTKSDIVKQFNVEAGKIETLYQSVHPSFLNADISWDRQYFLFVGTVNERKNLMLVAKAMQALPKNERPLVKVVGRGKKYKDLVMGYLKEQNLLTHFEFFSSLSNKQLIKLYQHAKALVMPSFYEGFGRPVIEALHLKVPVIISKSSSLPEIAGQYGIVIDYYDAESLAKAIKRISKENTKAFLEGSEKHLEQFETKLLVKKLESIMQSIVHF